MISYREKQLLATMKYLQDGTNELSEKLTAALVAADKGEAYKFDFPCRQSVEDYDELVQLAEDAGYDCYIRADDILTPEEIADLERRKEEIEEHFKSLVKLQDADYVFLVFATLLQIVKQIFLKLDISAHEIDASDADAAFKLKYDCPDSIDGSEVAKRYYAPFQQIANTKTVPYDIVKNTKYFGGTGKETGLGLFGDSHRFKSVGHDPILGLLFGTTNIMTNTATFYMDPGKMSSVDRKKLNKFLMATFHVRYKDMAKYKDPYIASFASSALMFDKALQRVKTDRGAVYAALVKEIDHIKSDQKSIAGIPLPFFSLILGNDKAQELAMEGFDWDHFVNNAAVVGKQAGMAIMINIITALLHRVYLLWDRFKEETSFIDALKFYAKAPISEFDNIRTKKIIMYSDSIASTVNLSVCLGGGVASTYFGHPELAQEFLSHLDIGGLIVTIGTLLKDGRYILRVKDDFIKATINEDFQRRLAEVEAIT